MKLFTGEMLPDIVERVVRQYCASNWQRLDCFMIFYIRNIERFHWVLNVAVNPAEMIAAALDINLHENKKRPIYGHIYIDSLNGQEGRGCAVSETENRELIFLLNYMS